MLQRLEVQKIRIILSLLSASHYLVFDPIIRIMKGGFTTVMVGSFLLTILSNIANSTHSVKLCDSSLDCQTGLLCSPDRLLCVCTSACFDCSQLKRLSRSNCTAKSSDCGSCLPGFVPSWEGVHCEDRVATERLRGSHSISPWNIIFATVAITAALSVCGYCGVGTCVRPSSRKLSTDKKSQSNNLHKDAIPDALLLY